MRVSRSWQGSTRNLVQVRTSKDHLDCHEARNVTEMWMFSIICILAARRAVSTLSGPVKPLHVCVTTIFYFCQVVVSKMQKGSKVSVSGRKIKRNTSSSVWNNKKVPVRHTTAVRSFRTWRWSNLARWHLVSSVVSLRAHFELRYMTGTDSDKEGLGKFEAIFKIPWNILRKFTPPQTPFCNPLVWCDYLFGRERRWCAPKSESERLQIKQGTRILTNCNVIHKEWSKTICNVTDW